MLLRKPQMARFVSIYQTLTAGNSIAASHEQPISFMYDQKLMQLRGPFRHAESRYDMKHPT